MADTLVQNLVDQNERRGFLFGPYWSDINTAVILFLDNQSDLHFARTTDKGASWSDTQIEAGSVVCGACWYDKETPGDTGTLVHIAWLDDSGEDAKYVTLDVATGVVGTIRTVDATTGSTSGPNFNRVAITKTVNGNIIYAYSTNGPAIECFKSSDNFATAGTDIADVFESGTEEDWVLLYPADVDAGDAIAFFWDRSANEITVKEYDDSANTWTERSLATSMTDDDIYINYDASVRHSDSHVLLAAHSNHNNTTDDLRTFDVNVSSFPISVTAKTDVFTNQNGAAQVSVFIDQNTDDVYIAYLKGGTWEASVNLVFHKSTDGMGVWGAEQAYSQSGDDHRLLHAGRIASTDGGRYQPAFYDDDDIDIFVNLVNAIEIAAAAAAGLVGRRAVGRGIGRGIQRGVM